MSRKNLLVVIDDRKTGAVNAAVDRMKAAGLAVTSVMEDMGLVRGTAEEAVIPELRKVPEVENVEEEETVHIAPPGSPIQ